MKAGFNFFLFNNTIKVKEKDQHEIEKHEIWVCQKESACFRLLQVQTFIKEQGTL